MYRVVVRFTDLQDNNYHYRVGDTFPRCGKKVSKERLEELSSNHNKRGVVLIVNEGLSEAREDTEEVETGVGPSDALEAKKKPRRRQKR